MECYARIPVITKVQRETITLKSLIADINGGTGMCRGYADTCRGPSNNECGLGAVRWLCIRKGHTVCYLVGSTVDPIKANVCGCRIGECGRSSLINRLSVTSKFVT